MLYWRKETHATYDTASNSRSGCGGEVSAAAAAFIRLHMEQGKLLKQIVLRKNFSFSF